MAGGTEHLFSVGGVPEKVAALGKGGGFREIEYHGRVIGVKDTAADAVAGAVIRFAIAFLTPSFLKTIMKLFTPFVNRVRGDSLHDARKARACRNRTQTAVWDPAQKTLDSAARVCYYKKAGLRPEPRTEVILW